MNVKYDKQTPVGYAAYFNKLKCLEAISSVPEVDLTLGVCSSLPSASLFPLHLFIPPPSSLFLFLSFISLILNPLAQYGNGIIKLSTESKYFGRKKKNTCTIWQWNNQIIHR